MKLVHSSTTTEDDAGALCDQLVTVVTLSGEIDSSDIAAVTAYTVRSALMGKAVLLDMSGVDFFAVQGLSLLFAVERTCRYAELPWIVVASRAVERVLQVSGRADSLPMANSAQVAMQYFACLAHIAARTQGTLRPLSSGSHAGGDL